MPPPKKLDLIPSEIRERLKAALERRGFAEIIDVTDELNTWLSEEGFELSIGKSAVGEYSKLLKDQRAALNLAETLLADMDIEAESDLHKVLLQMITTSAVKLMMNMSEDDVQLEAKDLMNLGRMLKDVMHSVGIREKVRTDERERIAQEAREKVKAEISDAMEGAMAEAGLSAERAADLRKNVLGMTA